jgi:hypothetical protein
MRFLLPYWRGVPPRCFYQDFQAGIIEALHELGHECSQFAFQDRRPVDKEEAAALYAHLTARKPDAVLDLAYWGYGLSRVQVPGEGRALQPILDAMGIPYAGWLFDQPWNQQMVGVLAAAQYAIYPDLGHPDEVRAIYPGLKLAGEVFAPPAVRACNDRSARGSSNRDIDVLYIGNLEADALERSWRAPRAPHDEHAIAARFCDALADAAHGDPDRSLHVSLQNVIAELAPLPQNLNLRLQVSVVERHLRHVMRRDAVLALARAGVGLRLVGGGWDGVELPGNVERSPATDYDGINDLAARARVCLDASTYLGGANDRVFSYALNRAVCFTNAAGYLSRDRAVGRGIEFYSMRRLSELADRVKALLGRPAGLREAGEAARATVLSEHTWRHRLTPILHSMGFG